MQYLDYIESLDPSRTLLTPRANRALLWTGQSSWQNAGLFPDQTQLLKTLFQDDALSTGFPFHQDCDQHQPSPVWRASLRNARQTLWCGNNLRYQQILHQTLHTAIQNTKERLTLLTASCGFEMLNAAFQQTQIPPHLEIQIIALGPTCLSNIKLPTFTAIQGRTDIYSKLLFRGPVHHTTNCGHLDYARCPETLQLLKRLVATN
jgi:hypothetical protein